MCRSACPISSSGEVGFALSPFRPQLKASGLRSVVHTISAESVRAATLAGCTEIEHGTSATQAELTLMAQHGTVFDPQVCLVFQNYIDHRDVYTRSGFDAGSFDAWRPPSPRPRRCSARRSPRRG